MLGQWHPPAELQQDFGKTGADTATNAAIRETEDLSVVRLDQAGINVDAAEVVDDHCQAASIAVLQDVIEQCGLARPQIATDDCERD